MSLDIFAKKIDLYEIECETPNHIYVGITNSIGKRWRDHCVGKGAGFTRLHGVKGIKIIKEFLIWEEAKIAEKNHVLYLKNLYPEKRISKGSLSKEDREKFASMTKWPR